MDIKSNVSLAPYTTIGIGGAASKLVEIHTVDELNEALLYAEAADLPVLVLGGGSNVLISDSGWAGLVIMNRILGVELVDEDDTVVLVAGGGEAWDDVVRHSVEAGLQGIECLSGIPGTVGASPIQNIGAYGQEVKDTIAWVEAVERRSGDVVRFDAADCGFAYRWSRFKGDDRDRYVVSRVAFRLKRNGKPELRYGDLTRYFEQRGVANPGLSEVRQAVLEVRRSKGMVVDPAIPDSRSCGSFFMNPIVSVEEAARVKEIVARDGLMGPDQKMPEFPAGEGTVKLSAAWLMEKAGLEKGLAMGGVGLSTCHVLALVNRGGGTSTEILALVEHVKQSVRDRFGIELHPEPVFLGFKDQPNAELKANTGQ